MLDTIRHVIQAADLRNKILFTLFIVMLYRWGAQLPAPGVDLDAVQTLRDEASEAGGIFNYLNLFSGGSLASLSLFSLGILPYITASIIMQILTVAIPKLEEWQSQGAVGQNKINQWTRYVTIVLALIQSSGFVYLASTGQALGNQINLFPQGGFRLVLAVVCMTTGTALLMWMGELISERGIGNGMSILIFASVVAGLPALAQTIYTQKGVGWLIFSLVMLAVLCAGIVFVEQGQRRIPVQFAKRVVGRRMYGGNNTYIPLKVNQAGVIPVIFASSLLQLPTLLANLLPASADGEGWGDRVRSFLDSGLYRPDSLGYILVFGFLIVAFAYFYNSIAFDPARRADELRRSGGFIPGVRPGPQTETYLSKVLNRITLPGAVWLAGVAVIPTALLARLLGDQSLAFVGFSGISILIGVGVSLEIMKQVDSQLMQRNYEGFLD